jgi:hypothetical protein
MFFFLVINLILTKFKKTTKQVKIDHTIIDYNKLKLSTGLSKSVLKKTVHRFQVSVSKMSCDFVLTRASNTEFHEKIITGLIRLDDDSRFVIPGHLATSILIQYSMKKESTLFKISATRILSGSIIDIVNIFYISCSSGFEIVETNELKPRLPFIVIEGVTEYNDRVESKKSFVERLNEAGLREIVCCYMAKHDQYPGKKLESTNSNFESLLLEPEGPYSLFSYRKNYLSERDRASVIGCSSENASLFFIKHIFCSSLSA